MHELSLAMSVASIVGRQMENYPGRRLTAIEIEVGTQSGVDLPSFRTAMDSVVRTSPWPEAAVELNVIEAVYQCLDCESRFRPAQFSPSGFYPSCPDCVSERTLPVAGREFRLKALRIE